MQTNNSSNTSNQIKPDEFRVGDAVYCVLYGKGEVTYISDDKSTYPIEVQLTNGEVIRYTLDGKYSEDFRRTLFFSEPKIEASVTRPFVS